MYKSHKIRLSPNNQQITYFMKACGTARKTYNWALAEWEKQYLAHLDNPDLPKPHHMALKKQFNAIKKTEFPWMKDVTKCAPESAFEDLHKAFQSFFKKTANYPKFKSKNRSKLSFRINNQQFKLQGQRIRIPNLGWVRMTESLRFEGKLISATISKVSNQWFVSIIADTPDRNFAIPNSSIGVDLGIKKLATLSTGRAIDSPNFHKNELPRLRRLNKELSRRQKGSKNWERTRTKLATLHRSIASKRLDHMHKFTTELADTYQIIGVEDLHVAGMIKNHRLAVQFKIIALESSSANYYTKQKNGRLIWLWWTGGFRQVNCALTVGSKTKNLLSKLVSGRVGTAIPCMIGILTQLKT